MYTRETFTSRFPDLESSEIILAGFRGSHAHGTYIAPTDPFGTDDTDMFAIFARPREFYGSVTDMLLRPKDVYSSAGETLDIEAMDVRKFVALLVKGNPNVHSYLWTDDLVLITTASGVLHQNRRNFFSHSMFHAFSGYVKSRLEGLQNPQKSRYMGEKRQELLESHGYDVKDASHCLRLAHQLEYVATFQELPVMLQGEVREHVVAMKTGKYSLHEAQALIDAALCKANEAVRLYGHRFPEIVDLAVADRVLKQTLDCASTWGGPLC